MIIYGTIENDTREATHKLCLNKYSQLLFSGGTYISLEYSNYYQIEMKDYSIITNTDNVRVKFNKYYPF